MGDFLPRVTKVIDSIRDEGLDYMRTFKKDELEAAAKRGTLIDSVITDYLRGKRIDHRLAALKASDPDALAYFNQFVEWREKYVEDVLMVQEYLVNERYGYCGTLDMVVRLKNDKRPTLYDMKRVASLSRRYLLQTAAYKEMADEKLGMNCRRGFLLFSKGEMKPVPVKDDPKEINIFLYFLSGYKWLHSK